MITSIAPMMAMAVANRRRNLGHPYDNYNNSPQSHDVEMRIRCTVDEPTVTDISLGVTTEMANALLDELYKIVKKQGYGMSNMDDEKPQSVEFNVSNKKDWYFGKFKELENDKAPNDQSYGPFIYHITYFPENFMRGADEHDYYCFFFKYIVENKKTVAAELVGFNVVYDDTKAFKIRKCYDTFITHTRVDFNKLVDFCKAASPENVVDKNNTTRTDCGIFNKIINLLKHDNEN